MSNNDPAKRLAAHRAAFEALRGIPHEEKLMVLAVLAAETIFAFYTVPERPTILRTFDKMVRDRTREIAEGMDGLWQQAEDQGL